MTSVVHAEYKKLAPYAECRYAEYHFAEYRGAQACVYVRQCDYA